MISLVSFIKKGGNMRKYFFLFFLALLLMSVQILSQPAIQWQRAYGGNSFDNAYSIQPTSEGGYIIAGSTSSSNGDVSGHHRYFGGFYETNIGIIIPPPSYDYWVVKLYGNGNIQWQKCLGGSSDDYARCVKPTVDGGYIVAGYSFSSNGDVSGNHGGSDYWVVKFDNGGNIQWQKCLGGSSNDYAYYIYITCDGGCFVGG